MKLRNKWLIPYLGQEMDRMSLEHLVLPDGEGFTCGVRAVLTDCYGGRCWEGLGAGGEGDDRG